MAEGGCVNRYELIANQTLCDFDVVLPVCTRDVLLPDLDAIREVGQGFHNLVVSSWDKVVFEHELIESHEDGIEW
jgi:hypothetical protein